MKITKIEASDIPDAWFQCIYSMGDRGYRYKVQRGAYAGQTRLELFYCIVNIKHPYSEPYDTMLPQIPYALKIPNPVKDGYIEQYLPYLMTDHIESNEQYTYGSRMNKQIDFWVKALRETPNTSQAILQVGQPDDYLLPDPPCLRHISMKVKDNMLFFNPVFRSWDLWGGFPANLAAIAVLQKYMADCIGIEQGGLVACSQGLHIYGYAEELLKIRTGRN